MVCKKKNSALSWLQSADAAYKPIINLLSERGSYDRLSVTS